VSGAGYSAGGGIWTSADTGVHWTLQPNSPIGPINCLGCSSNGSVIVVSDDTGVYISRDSGVTWRTEATPNGLSLQVKCTADGNTIYAAANLPPSNDGVNIWKGNSNREFLDANGFYNYEEGYLGPIYGFQWRSFNGEIDQLKYVLKEMNNNSRRIIINAWNPCQLNKQVLPPCHILYNFYISDNKEINDDENNKNYKDLSCMMFMRSSDLFLGLPFNIASTALFTYIIAKVMGMNVKEIAISICDLHIYEEHLEGVEEQLKREPYKFPKLNIKKEIDINLSIDEKIKWIESLVFEDFELIDYEYHPIIRGIMK
jgi:thymidylate synthase